MSRDGWTWAAPPELTRSDDEEATTTNGMEGGTSPETLLPGEPGASTPRPQSARPKRAWLVLAAVFLVLIVSVVVVVVSTRGQMSEPAHTGGADNTTSPSGAWTSGASGDGVADGSLATWRGRPVTIAGTWADNNQGMVKLPQLQPGGEYGSWDQSLDIAIGAIGADETWQAAAQGAYDDRWRESLTNLRDLWGDRPGTLYIRFAHEMNGNWYPWAVDRSETDDFIASWRRFRALQQEVFPASQLVFCVNRESIGNGMDWREAFPGRDYVDVVGVDYYNNYPAAETKQEFDAEAQATDKYGAPKGILQYLDFAKSVGLPLAVPEWSGNATQADSPAFITGMYDFFSEHAGSGSGQVLYDILFNVSDPTYDGAFSLFGETRQPEAAATYQHLW